MTQHSSLHGTWSSKLGFILATAGAAVGLGNIWMFPYIAGSHGGGAFVVLYLLCVALIGVPALLAEMVIGRRGKRNAADSMAMIASEDGHSSQWKWAGYFAMSCLVLVLSFYSVVSGWSLAYLARAFSGIFKNAEVSTIQTLWQQFAASPSQMLVWHSVFMCIVILVVSFGVQRGIERISLIKMPILFLILIILAGYGFTLPGHAQALHYLFYPDFSQLTASTVIAALGQALFSMAVGAGCMMAYGSYVAQHVRLVRGVWIITLLNVLVAFLAGFSIFSVVFSHGLAPSSGPELMYLTLPIAFSHMIAGNILAILFFMLLFLAAVTSAISQAEPLVALLMEKLHWRRWTAALCIGGVSWFIGIGSLLSFNVWQNVKLFHRWTVFDIATGLPTNIILPIGALSFVFFVGWIMTANSAKAEASLHSVFWLNVWRKLLRYLVPVVIIVIILLGLVG